MGSLFITVHALKNIKNGSHGTIHTFKNYFTTVLSVFSFQFSIFNFSNDKLNPNESVFLFWLKEIDDKSICECVLMGKKKLKRASPAPHKKKKKKKKERVRKRSNSEKIKVDQ